MKSRQINFYLTPKDVIEVNCKISELGMNIIPIPLPENKLVFIDSVDTSNTEYRSVTYLKPQNISEIKLDYIETQNYYLTDILKSPLIEFWHPRFNPDDKTMKRGRLYYTKQYYNAAGEVVQKDPEFLATADKLFRWIRKTFKDAKLPGYEGLLVSPRAAAWARETGGKLLVNN